jgi:hypothetical protein
MQHCTVLHAARMSRSGGSCGCRSSGDANHTKLQIKPDVCCLCALLSPSTPTSAFPQCYMRLL